MTSPDSPVPLKEYEYYVGHMKFTAQLTEAQAEAMGASEPGQAKAPEVGNVPNKEAQRGNSQMKDPDEAGATNDAADPAALDKARETRNRRAR